MFGGKKAVGPRLRHRAVLVEPPTTLAVGTDFLVDSTCA